MELPQGFHALRVPIPNNPLGFLLSYLIEGKDGHTLIDTGWNAPEAYDSLVSQLKGLGFTLSDISQIILTHMHPDHSGLTNQIKQASGAKVFCHELEAHTASQFRQMTAQMRATSGPPPFHAYGIPSHLYQNSRFGGGPPRMNFPVPDVLLVGGEIIDAGITKLEVIWTPGHAQGHICLYDRKNKVLFAGDHVLPITTPNVNLLRGRNEDFDPLGDYLSSIRKLKPLDVTLVLPAHDHIYEDLQGRLAEIEHHHEERLNEMRAVSSGDWKTAFEVAESITWAIGSFDSLENHHKLMAVGETLAHLEFLQKQGNLGKRNENGIIMYYSGKEA